MALLPSLNQPANVAIVGASGGIGAALVEQFAGDKNTSKLMALTRSGEQDAGAGATITVRMDVTSEQSIEAAAQVCAAHGPLDLVIVASGVLHRDGALRPEKRMRELRPDVMHAVFAINAIGPALVAKHFLPLMRSGRKTVFAALSARVGSIADNRLGGWASYRASKAALNMFLRTLAIEHARSRPEGIIAALHPGTVATKLSAPYRGGVPADKLFTPALAAKHLIAVIDGLTADDSGGFFAWDGSAIEF